MKILFGTRNKNKVVEAKAIFLSVIPNVELVSLDEIDPNRTIEEPIEDGNSFYENSLIKAKYYFEKTNIPTICDDSGIVVDALNGEVNLTEKEKTPCMTFEVDGLYRSKLNSNGAIMFYIDIYMHI